MNDEQFEQELQFLSTLASPPLIDQLRARDTAQREALAHAISGRSDAQEELVRALSAHDEAKAELALVEAERAELWRQHREAAGELVLVQAVRAQMREDRDAALFQLTEVLRILDQHRAWTGMGWEQLPVPVHAVEKIRRKLAQAEQQEAHCANCDGIGSIPTIGGLDARQCGACKGVRPQSEAQGAQGGDEDAQFVKWANVEYRVESGEELNLTHRHVIENRKGWMARAALATQPAVPVAYINYDSNGKPYLSWTPSNHPHRVLIDANPAVRGAEHDQ